MKLVSLPVLENRSKQICLQTVCQATKTKRLNEAQVRTLLDMSREKNTFKHGIMTTIIEECQLIFYYYKKLEKN